MKAEDMVNRNMDENSFQGSRKSSGKGFTNGMGGRKVQGQSQGLVNGNGLINGTGMTNGLASENGFINGTGVTNGFVNGAGVTNGLTNGMTNGMTNGLAPDFGNEMRINENAISPKKTSLVLIIVVLLIIPSIFLMYSYDDPSFEGGLRVDGDFSEWDDISLYSDPGTASTPALDISNYAVTTNERNDMFIYAQAQGSWLASANADSLCVFIDNDNDAGTGYIIEGMGAEYMIEIYGWESSIRGKQFSEFNGNDQHNWSAWKSGGSMSAALSGDQIEISVSSTHLSLGNDYKVLLLTKRGDEIGEICNAQFSEGKGALVVEQTPLDVSGVISANTVLELELSAHGSAVTVSSISFASTGVSSATAAGLPVTVSVGSPVVLNVEAPITALGQGTYVDIAVSAVSCDGTSNIIGNGLKAYAHAPPSEISIDGAFADWNVTRSTDTASDVDNPNVDISDYASVNSTTQAYFYLKVNDNGEIFAGGIVPQAREKPEAAGEPGEPGEPQPPKPLPRKTGEDMTRIYVDTVAGGQNIGGIRADFLIEIKGINGEITSRRLYSLPGKHFVKTIDAASGIRELEAGLTLTEIGYTGVMQVYFETTDWQKNKDTSEILVGGVRDGVRSSAIGPNLDSEPGASTLAQPIWPTWNLFANDTADTKSDGSSVTIAEPSVNITDLYSGNDTGFLYIRIKTMNTTQDSLTNRTFCVYVDVDGGGWNDWLIKENSTGLEYYYWDETNDWWKWNNTETQEDSDNDGAVVNTTDANGYWVIDFAINKTIVKNGTTVVGSYTKVGAASNATENLILNHTTANATISYLRDAWYYEDIISLTPIPEFSAMIVPLLMIIAIPMILRRKRPEVTDE